MKYYAAVITVALLIGMAERLGAAERLTVYCDAEACAMSVQTLQEIQAYIQALQDRVDKLMNTTGCT